MKDQSYNMMPLLIGPILKSYNPNFAEVEIAVMQYRTNPDAIAALLPDCFRPSTEPTVTMAFQDSNGVDFLAGNDYKLFMIAVAAKFEGEEHQVNGSYVLVMFENSSFPITLGRERLGVPKIYADITPLRILEDNHLRCEVSVWGHQLIGIDLTPPFKKQNALIRKGASTLASKQPLLGYKHIPATSLDDPPDADYPTAYYSEYKFDELWLGKTGRVLFGNPKEEDIRFYKPIVDALKTIPVVEVVRVSRSRGSIVLRNDLSYRLR